MRNMTLLLAGAAAILASPAVARDGAVYAGGEFGIMKANDSDISVNGADAVSVDYVFDLPDEGGWDGALFIGYDFGAFRLEGEVSMKEADIETYSSTIVLPGGGATGTNRPAVGSTDVMAFMLNGMFDFGDDDGLSAFIGAGAGWANVDLEGFGAFANQPFLYDDGDSGFAWQAFAGVRQAISDTVDVHVKYRYFNAGSIDLETGANTGDIDFSSHSLLGGITFNFGGAEPPPPPPPPPAPPPRAVPPPPPPPPPAPQPQTKVCPNGQTVPVSAACPAPPPPPVPPTGERG